MSVKSFECAIARSQIGRYLAGDPVGDEAMRQLEAHISGCADCQRLIDSKREELLGPLAGAPSAAEAVAAGPTVSGPTVSRSTVAPAETVRSEPARPESASAMDRELRAAIASARAVVQVPVAQEAVAAVDQPALAAAMAGAANAANPWNPSAAFPSNSGTPMGAPSTTGGTMSDALAGTGMAGTGIDRAADARTATAGVKAGRLPKLSLPKLVRDVPDDEPDPIVARPTKGVPRVEVAPTAETPKPRNRSLGKAAMYGGALVLVLGAMTVLGDPTALLGGKATAAEAGAKMKSDAAKPAPTKPKAALATGVRRSALGVPITDAVDANPVGEANAAPAGPKTLVAKAGPDATVTTTGSSDVEPTDAAPTKPAAKLPRPSVASAASGDPADLGPLEFDPTIDAPAATKPKPAAKVASASAGRPSWRASAPKPKPKPAASLVASAKIPTRPAAKLAATKPVAAKKIVAAKVLAKKAATKPVAAPLVRKPVAKPALANGKTAPPSTVAKTNAAKPVVRKARRPRAATTRRPAAKPVIRVYDENGKPIN